MLLTSSPLLISHFSSFQFLVFYILFIIFLHTTSYGPVLSRSNDKRSKLDLAKQSSQLLKKLCTTANEKKESDREIHSVSFISNAVNFQPVSNLRFSIVVACVCCLVSKKNSCLLLIFQENNGFSKKKQNF